MILVESIVGNVNQADWQQRLASATIDHLHLDQWQAQKNRFRRTTNGGVELAVSLDRNSHLHDGDILLWQPEQNRAVVCRIELQDVLVIQLSELLTQSPEMLARTCVELGHALGNQHWPAVVKDNQVFVPVTVDRKVVASVMKTHAFAGISYDFVAGREVIPYLAPHEARRLFGGADATPHSHAPHAHAHQHHHSH